MKQIPIPTERISPKAITVWRIQDLIFYSFTLLLFSALLFLTHYYHWFDWIRILLLITIGFIILQTVYKLSLHPILLQKTWRYSINMDYVQIRHGIFTHSIQLFQCLELNFLIQIKDQFYFGL